MQKPEFNPPAKTFQPGGWFRLKMNSYITTFSTKKQNVWWRNQRHVIFEFLYTVYITQQNGTKRIIFTHLTECHRHIVDGNTVWIAANGHKFIDIQLGKISRRFWIFLIQSPYYIFRNHSTIKISTKALLIYGINISRNKNTP